MARFRRCAVNILYVLALCPKRQATYHGLSEALGVQISAIRNSVRLARRDGLVVVKETGGGAGGKAIIAMSHGGLRALKELRFAQRKAEALRVS